MNIKYRLKFSKLDRLKFIGHLDLFSIFQRSIKMSKIPIAYSNGFNPHQKMCIAVPLSLGIESYGEYMDIGLTKTVDENYIKDTLNNFLPNGLKILKVYELSEEDKNVASAVMLGSYEIKFPPYTNIKKTDVENMLLQDEILMLKKTKKNTSEINIRKNIYSANLDEENNILNLLISAGSLENLKPNLVIEYLCKNIENYDKHDFVYIRKDLYSIKNEEIITLIP